MPTLDGRYLDDDLIGHAVDAPTISDPRLRRAIDGVHAPLSARDDPLETETHLTFVAERLRRHLGIPPHAYVLGRRIDAARRYCSRDGRRALSPPRSASTTRRT